VTLDELQTAYKRPVPLQFRIVDDSDMASDCLSKAGDVVPVGLPPDGVEVDSCSVFVHLDFKDGPRLVRMYDYEVQSV